MSAECSNCAALLDELAELRGKVAAGEIERRQRCSACGLLYADAREAADFHWRGGEHLCWLRDRVCREAAGENDAVNKFRAYEDKLRALSPGGGDGK